MRLLSDESRLAEIFTLLILISAQLIGCGIDTQRRQIPSEVQSAVETVIEDLAAERYEKIYNESSDLWKKDTTPEQSTTVLKTVKEKLGNAKTRVVHSATEQQNSGGDLKGHVFIVTYQTTFEKAPAMETFTFVERDHQWQLARYAVNSTELR